MSQRFRRPPSSPPGRVAALGQGWAHYLRLASYTNTQVLKERICLIIKVASDHCKKGTGGETAKHAENNKNQL